MNRKAVALCAAVIVSAGVWWAFGRGKARAADQAEPPAARNGVELTVYSEDFGLVHEARPVSLAAGDNKIPVTEVSHKLDPHSVLLDWSPTSNPGQLPQIVAQTYDMGVANTGELLNRYLGRQVEVVRYGDNGHEAERQNGALMVDSGGLAVRSEGKFYINPGGTIVTPADPGVATIPQLSVQANSPGKQSANLDVTYLTRGLSWSADYVGTLQPDGKSLKLECWATVTNQTGVDYPNAKVSLVAGSPNRAVRDLGRVRQEVDISAHWADGHANFAKQISGGLTRETQIGPAESMGDFHAYPIKAATTVGINRMNRLLMMSGPAIPAKMDYNTRAPQLSSWDDNYSWGTPDHPKKGTVAVAMSFKNREADGLGQPLPHGALRIYEPDSRGTLRYGGASGIQDTPKDEKIDVTLASSFDVFTEQRVVSHKQIDKHTVRKEVELTLHNDKAAPVDLRVVQSIGGSWKIVNESHKHINLDAYNTQWTVPLPAGSKTKLSYTVDLKY